MLEKAITINKGILDNPLSSKVDKYKAKKKLQKIMKPLSARSIRRSMSSIKVFHKYLFLKSVSDVDPASNIELPKVQKKIPDYLNIEEISDIFRWCDLHSFEYHSYTFLYGEQIIER